jgi:hypothetical protein
LEKNMDVAVVIAAIITAVASIIVAIIELKAV